MAQHKAVLTKSCSCMQELTAVHMATVLVVSFALGVSLRLRRIASEQAYSALKQCLTE